MTMKTKRGSGKQVSLAIGGGTVLCAALAILIATRFAPEPEATIPNTSDTNSTTQIRVEISTAKREDTNPIEVVNPESGTTAEPDNNSSDKDPDKESEDFIDNGGIEIEQNFPEAEKQAEPPTPPQIEDEEMLTNPDQEPIYEPEQIEVKPQPETPSDTPKHGDRKDGMIYINGFGWIKDEGGGGIGYTDNEMYQNGNKIGYFG